MFRDVVFVVVFSGPEAQLPKASEHAKERQTINILIPPSYQKAASEATRGVDNVASAFV